VLKVCVVGAGAIGCFLGTRLARSGDAEVSALARGATLAALREHGWRLREGAELLSGALAGAADEAHALGTQDLVIIALKSPALPAVAPTLAPLLRADTVVLPAMNGVPWWFGRGIAALDGPPLESVDPAGVIGRSIPLEHVVGCVIHAGVVTAGPALSEHRMGRGLILGEPSGTVSARVERLRALFERAGFDASASARIRYDIWYKLWGNMTMNPVTALTGATMDRVLDDPLTRAFCSQAMREAAAVGARIGCDVRESPEERHAVTRKLGAFKTSMLQDVEAGRAIELDALAGAVREIGARVGVATPSVDALFGLARLFGRVHGLYPR
jgi:2-dehydropantoate 2-reductase